MHVFCKEPFIKKCMITTDDVISLESLPSNKKKILINKKYQVTGEVILQSHSCNDWLDVTKILLKGP